MPNNLRYYFWLLCFLPSAFMARAKVFVPHYPDFFEQHVKQNTYSIDTGAEAIVLYELNENTIDHINHHVFMHKHVRKIIKIVTESGEKYGDVIARCISRGEHAYGFSKIKCTTYNWRDGALTADEMNDDIIEKQMIGSYVEQIKFSMPAVVAGSVIDYSYETDEPLSMVIGSYYFTEVLPVLYWELKVRTPGILKTNTTIRGKVAFRTFDDRDNKDEIKTPNEYTFTDKEYGGDNVSRWIIKDAPAYHNEPFLQNIKNYLGSINMLISGINGTVNNPEFERNINLRQSWDEVDKYYLKHSKMEKKMGEELAFMDTLLPKITPAGATPIASALSIYGYVRDSFTIVKRRNNARNLDSVYQRRKGTQTDLNLLMMGMLRKQGISCDLAIMATSEHPHLSSTVPELQYINYVCTMITLNGKNYLVDPSRKYNSFGVLPYEWYNGYTRVINESNSYGFVLSTDQLFDKNVCTVTTENADADNYTLHIKQTYGNESAYLIRKALIKDTADAKTLVLKELDHHGELLKYEFQNLNSPDSLLVLTCSVRMPWKDDAVYFLPSIINHFNENPFKSAERQYPVESKYAMQCVYEITLKVPGKYIFADTAQTAAFKMDDNTIYRYASQYNADDKTLRLNTVLTMKRTVFKNTEYDALKDFINKILGLQQTPYLFKKQ